MFAGNRIVEMKSGRVWKSPLVDIGRINEIGGLNNPDIRRIICAFVDDLPGCLLLIDRLREEQSATEMLAALHKLAGSSLTCGFTGINRAIESWDASGNIYKPNLHTNLRAIVEASIVEWQHLVD